MEGIPIEIENEETGETIKFKASCNVSGDSERRYGHPDSWHDSYQVIEDIEIFDQDDKAFPKETEKELWKNYSRSIHNQVELAVANS